MTIGDRIKKIREINEKNQRDFAASIKIGQSTLAMFENSQREPKDIHIEQICIKYGINEEWLRNGEGEMKKNADTNWGSICADIGINDPKAVEAITKYYALNDDDKKLWWNWMERFLGVK